MALRRRCRNRSAPSHLYVGILDIHQVPKVPCRDTHAEVKLHRMQSTSESVKASRNQRVKVKEISAHLLERYGPLLGRTELVKVLGFPSGEAFDRYLQRGHLTLKLVRPPNRRGVFALAPDVAEYLVDISRGEEAARNESEKG